MKTAARLASVLVLLACLSAAAAGVAAPPGTLVLSAGERMVALSGRFGFFYDADNQATIESLAVSAGTAADPFRPLPHDLALGYVRGTVWLRLEVLRPAAVPGEWWLEVRRPVLDQVVLYQPAAGGGWSGETLGDQTPWAGRTLKARNAVFLLDLPAGVPRTLYLRIRSTSNMGVTFWLWRPAAFAEANGRQFGLYAGFALTAAVIVLIGLAQGIALRDRGYLIYAAYVAVLATFIVSSEGLVHVLLDSPRVVRLEPLISLLHPGIPALMAFLTRELLQLRQYFPRVDRVYRYGGWLVLGVGVLAVPGGFDVPLKPLWWWVLLVELPVNCGLALWLGLRGVHAAWFYLAAFGVVSLTSVWSLLAALGLTGGRTWTHEMTILGSLVHMVLMQLTVTERVQSARRAHEQARERALRAEQLATGRLDAEVARRTEELRHTLARLEATSARLGEALALQTQTAAALTAAKETAERALGDQRQLTTMLSHELRNPLAAIDAATQLLILRHGADESVAALGWRIRRGSARARRFLTNCLTGERIAADRLALECRPVDLGRLTRGALDAAESESESGAGRLRLDCPSDLPTLEGDPELLGVLLLNLLENALQYSPPETRVTLRVTVVGDLVQFAVQDQGPGIPTEDRDLVFEKYRRGRQAGALPGAGLGLALVARICELHRGQVELASTPGSGTRVTVTLPLGRPPESTS